MGRSITNSDALLSITHHSFHTMQGTRDLTTGPILHQLFKLAGPIMATSFVQMAYSLTDMAWVGRLGSEAVAAIGAVGILTWMSSSLSLLNKVGTEVSVAQAIGQKDETAARAFASHNITIASIIALSWCTLLFIFARPVISLFSLEAEISATAVSYLRLVLSGLPFYIVSATFTGLFNASGRSQIPFAINAVGLVLNIVLDPLFIFVIGWGTDGAAIATALSQLSVFLLFIYRLKVKQTLFPHLSLFTRLKRRYTSRILHLGTPAALLNLAFAFINMYMCKIAASTGGHIGLMTLTAGGQIEAITWNTAQGFSTALSSFVAQNYAAGKVYRVLKAYRTTLWLTGCIGFVCTFLFVFLGKEIFAVFVPEEAAYMAGSVFMRIDGYSQVFMMLEITMEGMFYGTGRSVQPAVISIGGNVLRIPLSVYLVSIGLGVSGIWWAISLSSILKGACALLWFHHMKKRIFSVSTL